MGLLGNKDQWTAPTVRAAAPVQQRQRPLDPFAPRRGMPQQVGGGMPGSPQPPGNAYGLRGTQPGGQPGSMPGTGSQPQMIGGGQTSAGAPMMMAASQRGFPQMPAQFGGFGASPYAQAPQMQGYGMARPGGPIGGQMSYMPPPAAPPAVPPAQNGFPPNSSAPGLPGGISSMFGFRVPPKPAVPPMVPQQQQPQQYGQPQQVPFTMPWSF